MSTPISLFSGYSQKENRVTNYCLLILKMVYEANPNYLGEVLSKLLDDDIQVGVTFRQQVKKEHSVPDGLIVQSPITIYLETKNYDWFYDSQLESHLSALDSENVGQNVLIALGNFDIEEKRFEKIIQLCETRYSGRIMFVAVSFHDFIAAIDSHGLPKHLSDAVADFESFLDSEGMLPTWRTTLDVVNCAPASSFY